MNQPHLITIKAKSRTGQVVEFHVAEILEIDGQPLNREQPHLITSILTRLDALERAAGLTGETDA